MQQSPFDNDSCQSSFVSVCVPRRHRSQETVLRELGWGVLGLWGFLFCFVFQQEVRHIIASEALVFIVRFILCY